MFCFEMVHRYKIQEILEPFTEVDHEQIIIIRAKVIISDCGKMSKIPLENCGEMENAKSSICHFIILELKGDMNITCEHEPKNYTLRVKRDITSNRFIFSFLL